jgi:predicted transcriptional regulator
MMTKKTISTKDFQAENSLSAHSLGSRAVARALDQRADRLPHAMVFTSIQFEEFLSKLTPKRFELLRIASKGEHSIAALAAASNRDPSAVSRDVSILSNLGLVSVLSVANEGHGQKKIVKPIASTIAINAAITAD